MKKCYQDHAVSSKHKSRPHFSMEKIIEELRTHLKKQINMIAELLQDMKEKDKLPTKKL